MEKAFVWDLQQMEYGRALALMREIHTQRVRDEISDVLLLVEHPPVLTLGKSGNPAHLLISEKDLMARGIRLFHIERGGDITYHGPGQLVVYPIFRIGKGLVGVRPFVNGLEEAVILALDRYGIGACRRQGLTGVWVGERKICAIGVAFKRWVTMHGLALNVSTDLDAFDLIVPCGIRNAGVTSMDRELGWAPEMEEVKRVMVETMGQVFDKEFEHQQP